MTEFGPRLYDTATRQPEPLPGGDVGLYVCGVTPYADAHVGHAMSLIVYDVLGREVAVLVDHNEAAGAHEVNFEASHLPSGLYVVRLRAAGRQFSQAVLLAK